MAKKNDMDVTLPRVVVPVIEVKPVQAYGVYQGERIMSSHEDESLAHAIANRLKSDCHWQGLDLSSPEHKVEVRQL